MTQFDDIATIYVAGPITGMPDNNRKAFRAAEAYLTNQGLTVLSPEAIQPRHKPERITHGQYMEICLAMIKAVQAVYFLAGGNCRKARRLSTNGPEHSENGSFTRTPARIVTCR
jgi:hypothetical protein